MPSWGKWLRDGTVHVEYQGEESKSLWHRVFPRVSLEGKQKEWERYSDKKGDYDEGWYGD